MLMTTNNSQVRCNKVDSLLVIHIRQMAWYLNHLFFEPSDGNLLQSQNLKRPILDIRRTSNRERHSSLLYQRELELILGAALP